MSTDPADLARERAAEVSKLIAQAEKLEAKATASAVVAATNLRARAICIHLRIGSSHFAET